MTALQNREWEYLGRIMAALAVYEPESPLVERATRDAWAHLTGAHLYLAERSRSPSRRRARSVLSGSYEDGRGSRGGEGSAARAYR